MNTFEILSVFVCSGLQLQYNVNLPKTIAGIARGTVNPYNWKNFSYNLWGLVEKGTC